MRKAAELLFRLLRETASEFLEDDCPRMAAALSYYTVFSLPPLLVIVLAVAGAATDPETVRRVVEAELGRLIGPEVEVILRNLETPGERGALGTVLGVGALLFGATGAFAQLQASLNAAWEIRPDPARGGVRNFLFKRALSFGMVLGIGFLLLVSLVLSTLLAAFGDALTGRLFGWTPTVMRVLNTVLSFLVVAGLFATMYRVLPDAVIRWRDVAVGALATAALFVAGKTVIGLYLGRSDPGSAYGAAGSLAVLLVWIYYSSMILLLGAEFTQVWARLHGVEIIPEAGAVCTKGKRESAPPRPRRLRPIPRP